MKRGLCSYLKGRFEFSGILWIDQSCLPHSRIPQSLQWPPPPSPIVSQSVTPQAARFPFLFFFPISLIGNSIHHNALTSQTPLIVAPATPQQPSPSTKYDTRKTINILGGKLCFNFSALSVSCRTRVYKYRRHRTLNLI